MIEAGQAVYFIENRGMDPVIKFGIVRGLWEERGFYHCNNDSSYCLYVGDYCTI